jgi:nucleoside-diphosphate-sugar epimerase
MRALITGNAGFLGRHFTAELKARGWDVVGCDIKTTLAQDCRNLFRRDVRMRDMQSWDLVVHCAAVVGGRETIENDPLKTAESLSIDAEVFRWAAVARPGRVLYLSSSAAYPVSYQKGGRPVPYRLHEDDVWGDDGLIEPDEIYGWSKVTGEILAGRLRQAGVPVTVVRPFSGYGADQSTDYPFRAILERARRHEDPLTVWCGACVRDWVHVSDVVNGALAVAENGTEEPVNVCTGRATTFWELAELMGTAAGYQPALKGLSDKPQGVMSRVGNPNRFFQIYRPVVTLEEAIKKALAD